MTILVVDDSPDVRDSLAACLENEGYDVMQAGDGLEGLDQVRSNVPDLILLDINMPRMNGLQFAEELRRQKLRPRVPIIVLTGAEVAERSEWAVQSEGCLAKPFSVHQLLRQVRELTAE